MIRPYADLFQEIRSFLLAGEGNFDALALQLFAYQYARNAPYRAFCEALSRSPESVKQWQDIPAVPIGAFKSTELCTFPASHAAAVFHSSATTTGSPSRHFIKDLSYYEASLRSGFGRNVLRGDAENRPAFLILTPSPAESSHSSLSWMMDVVKRKWGGPGSDYFLVRGRADEPRLERALGKLQASGQPLYLLGTTIAFLVFFEFLAQKKASFRLPAGSRLMDTGGMKTEKRQVTREAFVSQACQLLGLDPDDCVNEYGMCELSSQFYGSGKTAHLEGPAWVRTRTIDLATGQEAAAHSPGVLCQYDLANVDSVLAVQTEDLGTLEGRGFVLHGRAPAADLKGCSLSVDQFLS